jgi:hypothetical protein
VRETLADVLEFEQGHGSGESGSHIAVIIPFSNQFDSDPW